jgi:hypothetical protein
MFRFKHVLWWMDMLYSLLPDCWACGSQVGGALWRLSEMVVFLARFWLALVVMGFLFLEEFGDVARDWWGDMGK